MQDNIFQNFLNQWHEIITSSDADRLEQLLDDEVVFYSPVVFTPQRGKHLTKLYLLGASIALKEDFKYRKKIIDGRHGVLEFECVIDGITVEGVDIIELNEAGKIRSFKVMVRPLKAIQKVHEKMGQLLDSMKP